MTHHRRVQVFRCPAVGENPIADSTLKPYGQFSAMKRKEGIKKPKRHQYYKQVEHSKLREYQSKLEKSYGLI